MAEFEFIGWLRQELAKEHSPNRRLAIPPGDDTALVPATERGALFAADMLMAGVHFDLATTTAELVGRKALAVNLSDIAAMAGTPTSVTVALALPRQGGEALAKGVSRGLIELAGAYNVAVAGGDTNSWDGPLVVSVAILGDPHPRGSVTRAGARPGDQIFVTGELGGSLAGHHLHFNPRLAEARLLHERYGLTAMIDLSDGLGADLRHILKASGVGAVLHRGAMPISPAALRLAAEAPARAALTRALADGEDFELCFTLPDAAASRLLAEAPLSGLNVSHIGEITAAPGLVWEDGSAVLERGYAHSLN